MDSPLDRKLKREIAARKQAEHLLEAKSLELFSTNQQLQDALRALEKSSDNNLKKLDFQSKIDAILIDFGRTFLVKDLDEVVLANFTQRLCDNSVVESSRLTLNKGCNLQLILYCFGNFNIDFVECNELCWHENLLHIPLKLNNNLIGTLSVRVRDYDGFEDTIQNSMTLVAELLLNAVSHQIAILKNIQSRKRAEASERSTRDFLAMINHELRTPLNGLLGSAELLHDAQLNEPQQDLVKNIEQSGEFLRTIINDLLDFSKINAGMFELIPRIFSSSELHDTLNSIFSTKAQEKSIAFSITATNAIPEYFHADLERITQVLVNVIGNSIKFTESGSVIVEANWNEPNLFLTVKDTGIGISEKAQNNLFQPFIQADLSSKRQFEGTGLGLAICGQLVALMNGTIKLSSTLGVGSTVEITLPLTIAEKPPVITNEVDPSLRNSTVTSLSILVVEDIRMNQIVIEQMMSKFNIKPDLANNGLEAIEAACGKDYDLIFMDYRMPVMDGLEATRRLRQSGFTAPIIALTAGTTSSERELCMNSGMNDILTKPYRGVQLIEMIQKWSK
ncbi:ATP-binding protein [Vibrio tapetis]|uniref:histidine kinase n=1 Tax=Vibrio tapetis subsp. tapetis TaxID=1671868 RepID=A0A2N8ZA06_9VIBR|nr:ATP-binding protein [Vibrio tapetis]SON48703.1 conserved protein of unknown function [Vibrio tapetis subsp. tapetis]